jgi:hypothetical protein
MPKVNLPQLQTTSNTLPIKPTSRPPETHQLLKRKYAKVAKA